MITLENFCLRIKLMPGYFWGKLAGTFLVGVVCVSGYAGERILVPVGKTEVLPFRASAFVHVSNGKILKLREQGGKIFATGSSPGELTITNQSKKYKVYVLDERDIKTYNELFKLTQTMRGLRVEILNNRIYVLGDLLRLSDWEKLSNIAKEKNLKWILKTTLLEKHKKSMLEQINKSISNSSLPIPSLSTEPELQAIISSTQKNYKERYRDLLEPVGFKVIEDANALQLEPMVDLQVQMVELKKNSFHKLGIDLPQSYSAQVVPSENFKMTGNPFEIALNALEQDGNAKIIASPHLSCRSGKEAKFLAGGEFPIKIMNFKTNDIQWKKHGILLTFKPLADRSGKMSISLNAEISILDQAQAIDGVPGLLVNRVESHLDLQQSQTIALSGLIKEHIGRSHQGLALLKNIPVLGLLFSSEDYREERTDLVIFVTPRVLADGVIK